VDGGVEFRCGENLGFAWGGGIGRTHQFSFGAVPGNVPHLFFLFIQNPQNK
jgi:hypothetical protein